VHTALNCTELHCNDLIYFRSEIWTKEVHSHKPRVLVMNKCDKTSAENENEEMVTQQEVEAVGQRLGMVTCPAVSAKTGVNVQELLSLVAQTATAKPEPACCCCCF
jgi:GTPase SAR1 family protein